MIGFIIGFFIGGMFGFLIAAGLAMAKEDEDGRNV
jgi:hypothetical protein